jgi:hypothetical protein
MGDVRHEGNQPLGAADLLLGHLKRHASPVEHHKALGDAEDVVDVMADEEDRAPALAHGPDEAEDLLRLGQREGGGGLVQNDEVGVVVDGAGDGDALPLAPESWPTMESGEKTSEVKPISRMSRSASDLLGGVEEAQGAGDLPAHEDVATMVCWTARARS